MDHVPEDLVLPVYFQWLPSQSQWLWHWGCQARAGSRALRLTLLLRVNQRSAAMSEETFLGVEFGPRREVELLSQALWYQQESQENNVFDLHFPSAMSPHRERKGEQNQSTDQAPHRGNWGFQTKRATPGLFFVHILQGYPDSALETRALSFQCGH